MNRSVGSLTTLKEPTQLSSHMVFSDVSHPQACLWSSCSAARVPRRRDRWSAINAFDQCAAVKVITPTATYTKSRLHEMIFRYVRAP